jgi:hypothetical protein
MRGHSNTAPVESTEVEVTEYHTPQNPYCPNLGCSCHTDLDYHAQVTEFDPDADVEDDPLFAYSMATLGAK